MDLVKKIVKELRRRGNKTVKSVYWNSDKGDLAVFPVGYKGSSVDSDVKSFNLFPEPEWSVDEIVDRIEAGFAGAREDD